MKRPLTPRQNLGRTLRSLRWVQKLTQWELAKALRYNTAQFISNWERGISVPPTDKIIPLAKELGVNALDLADLILSTSEDDLAIKRKQVMTELRAALKTTKGKRK